MDLSIGSEILQLEEPLSCGELFKLWQAQPADRRLNFLSSLRDEQRLELMSFPSIAGQVELRKHKEA